MTDAEKIAMARTIAKIAQEELDLDTFDEQGSDDLDFHECGVASVEAALREAFEAGQRAERHGLRPPTMMLGLLDYLATNDRNGLWDEYLENYADATEEHGEISLNDITQLVIDMKKGN